MCYNINTSKEERGINSMKEWYDFWMCPTENYNCPWCNANGECMLDRPQDECDDFMTAYADITIDPESVPP